MAKTVPASELIELCALEPRLFASEFFPETVRQESALFHSKVWEMLESSARLVNIQMFRGSGKTTTLRLFMAKRIAYGISRTIMYIGRSQDKAIQSLVWLRRQIEHNKKLKTVYSLAPGSKWQDVEIRIQHGILGHEIAVLAYGITGSIRGVNIDDYRPDLIIVDDFLDEENSATDEQRDKMSELLYGALVNSLSPASETPDAKLALLQTPHNKLDVSTQALEDPSWLSLRIGCWTPETEELAVHDRESSWSARFSTDELLANKQAHLRRNAVSTFLREMECKLSAPETSAFRASWLHFYDLPPERESMIVIGAIDPVPPPTDAQLAKGLKGKDSECLAILGSWKNEYYLLDYSVNRGHEPSWTVAEFFRLSLKYKPSVWVIEAIAYQKTLEWILRQSMKERGIYFPVNELRDKRSKYDRIVDAFAGPASNGVLHLHKSHTEFISQFTAYPDVPHDDVLDAFAMCMLNMPLFGVGVQPVQSNPLPRSDNVAYLNSRPVRYHYGAP